GCCGIAGRRKGSSLSVAPSCSKTAPIGSKSSEPHGPPLMSGSRPKSRSAEPWAGAPGARSSAARSAGYPRERDGGPRVLGGHALGWSERPGSPPGDGVGSVERARPLFAHPASRPPIGRHLLGQQLHRSFDSQSESSGVLSFFQGEWRPEHDRDRGPPKRLPLVLGARAPERLVAVLGQD